MPTTDQVNAALGGVTDPLLDKPVTELGMIDDVAVDDGRVAVGVLLPIPGHPEQDRIRSDVEAAVARLDGVTTVDVAFAAMPDDKRAEVGRKLRGNRGSDPGGDPVIPFNQVESHARLVAIASGKGGVGKSSITANLAVALAREGMKVGILDADIWGYSIPRMLGASGRPIAFENMVLPLRAHGCKVISIGFFVDAERPVIWRGPMLHRALQQFLADVHWGDLDYLFCDLPPGTGDIAISLAQMLPNADMVVVTTPQQAAQRVALRAGQSTAQTGMKVAGVIENMAIFVAPDTGKEYRIFGEGGGSLLAAELDTEFLGSVPIDPRLREGADAGVPLVVSHPEAPASKTLEEIARRLGKPKRSLVGKSLPLKS